MKVYNKLMGAVFFVIVLIVSLTNFYLRTGSQDSEGRMYRVEISRLADEIAREGYDGISLFGCQYVDKIEHCKISTIPHGFFEASDKDYCVRQIGGTLYRFDYTARTSSFCQPALAAVNLALAAVSVLLMSILFYIRWKIIKPFEMLKEVPFELAKGSLAIPMPEQKNHYFGRFIWGIDLLRESIEQQKKRELKLQRTQKTMILSISHDIKTPLSAIKLYAKVIIRNMYENTAQLEEIAQSIHEKADEVGEFVRQMIKASGEDFLYLEVAEDQFYLSQLVEKMVSYYKDKLGLLHTEFLVETMADRMLMGDFNRSVEVLHNLMENAVKYGDGETIMLTCSEEEGCVLITVKNSGNTLPETELVHIFDSFWRGSNAGNNAGSGLGLYICRLLMQRMGGDLFAQVQEGQMCVTAVFRT